MYPVKTTGSKDSVRLARVGDMPSVACVHKARFSSHLLGHFSVRFLTLFYTSFLGRSPFLVHETGASSMASLSGANHVVWQTAGWVSFAVTGFDAL